MCQTVTAYEYATAGTVLHVLLVWSREPHALAALEIALTELTSLSWFSVYLVLV